MYHIDVKTSELDYGSPYCCYKREEQSKKPEVSGFFDIQIAKKRKAELCSPQTAKRSGQFFILPAALYLKYKISDPPFKQ